MLRLERFLGDLATFFFLFWLPEIMTGSLLYCSRIYIRNWFTLFYMIKIHSSTWAGTRLVSWTQHWSFAAVNLGGEKIPLPTDPLEKWRIVCGKRIYFEGWTYICRIIHWLVLFSLYIVLCSDWPAFCRRAHILFALFVFVYLKWCSTHSVLCFLFLCLVYLSYVSGLSIFYCPFGVY
jgi:hypothetical protein